MVSLLKIPAGSPGAVSENLVSFAGCTDPEPYLMVLESNHPLRPAAPLVAYLNEICPLSEEAITVIMEQTGIVEYKKGQLLVCSGIDADNLYFIQKGVIRGYAKFAGRDNTMWLSSENELVGSIPDLGISPPSDLQLQLLEDSTLIRIPKAFLEYLYAHFPEGNQLLAAIREDLLRSISNKTYGAGKYSAEAKFSRFCETQEKLIARVDSRYIASFMGISVNTFMQLVHGNSIGISMHKI